MLIGKILILNFSIDADNASYIGAVKQAVIKGNVVGLHSLAKQHGINLRFAIECEIIGNIVYNNGDRGIRLYCSSNNIVKGNICKNNNQKGTTGDGVRLEDDGTNGCLYNVIIGNRCFDDQATKTQRYGLNITGTEDYNIVIGNNLRGNSTGGLNGASGTNDVVANNIT